jgi:hypothetical protein
MTRNFGWTFGRTPEGRDRDYADLVKRLETQPPENKDEDKPQEEGQENQTGRGWINNEWIYVPSINMRFAKTRSNYNLNWSDTHKTLIPQGLRMPKPEDTWALIHYLKANLSDRQHKEVYDDILKTTPVNTWHGEWQNAVYSHDGGKVYVQHVKGLKKNGDIDLTSKVEIKNYLTSDGWADITANANISDKGLCKVASSKSSYFQGENIYFWYPRDKAVARFDANSSGAVLDCDWYPYVTVASLGVRTCAEGAGAPKN